MISYNFLFLIFPFFSFFLFIPIGPGPQGDGVIPVVSQGPGILGPNLGGPVDNQGQYQTNGEFLFINYDSFIFLFYIIIFFFLFYTYCTILTYFLFNFSVLYYTNKTFFTKYIDK